MSTAEVIIDPIRTLLHADPELLVNLPASDVLLTREQRINEMHRARRKLIRATKSLIYPGAKPQYRVWWGPCTRCGYIWRGQRLSLDPPMHCAQCHSSYWQDAPARSNARALSDEPNPNWDRWRKRSDTEKRTARDVRRGTYVEPVTVPKPATQIDVKMVEREYFRRLEAALPAPPVPIPPPPRISGPVIPFPPPPRFSGSLSTKLQEVTRDAHEPQPDAGSENDRGPESDAEPSQDS